MIRRPNLIEGININKIIVSNKVPFVKGFKYLIAYKHDRKVKSLCIILPN